MHAFSHSRFGFSLIELLVALSILAVVAAIIVPRFLNVRSQAEDTMATAMTSQLQHTFDQWQSLGGTITLTGAAPTPPEYNTPIAFLRLISDSSRGAGAIGRSGTVTLTDSTDPTFGSRSLSLNITVTQLPTSSLMNQLMSGTIPSTITQFGCFYYFNMPPIPMCAYISSSGTVYNVRYDPATGFVLTKISS